MITQATLPISHRDHPSWIASELVAISVRALPAGAVRDRYHEEFLAELHHLPRPRQAEHALQILTHAAALRAATAGHAEPAPKETVMSHHHFVPISCRLNLFHSWRTRSTDDGGLYLQCHLCGKDRTGDDRPLWSFTYRAHPV